MEEIHRHTIEISRHNRLKEKNMSKLWMTIKRNTIDLPKKFRYFAQKNYIDIG